MKDQNTCKKSDFESICNALCDLDEQQKRLLKCWAKMNDLEAEILDILPEEIGDQAHKHFVSWARIIEEHIGDEPTKLIHILNAELC